MAQQLLKKFDNTSVPFASGRMENSEVPKLSVFTWPGSSRGWRAKFFLGKPIQKGIGKSSRADKMSFTSSEIRDSHDSEISRPPSHSQSNQIWQASCARKYLEKNSHYFPPLILIVSLVVYPIVNIKSYKPPKRLTITKDTTSHASISFVICSVSLLAPLSKQRPQRKLKTVL